MTDRSLAGKRVLITGGSSETGPFICREFLDRGAHVWTTYYSNEAGGRAIVNLAREKGLDGRLSHLDLLDQTSLDALIDEVRTAWPTLDILVLNCGSKGLRPFKTLTREQIDTAIDGNVKGNFWLAKQLGYWMKATNSRARIIQLTAMSADNATHSAYGLAKAAQNDMTAFLAYHLAPEVTVNTVAPITIDQDPDSQSPPPDAAPLGRQVHAREIARMCRLMCDEAFDTVTGEIIRMDGGRHVATAFPKEL